MTSFRQFEANRRNALKSTTSEEGKERSRCNAVRHGLTAETVIGAREDAEDYKGFEAAIIADYDAQTAVERGLVVRLASLLWRLRRATAMETGLFALEIERQRISQPHPVPATIHRLVLADNRSQADAVERRAGPAEEPKPTSDLAAQLARHFLQLASRPDFPLDRLSRYEAVLWRQAGQITLALDSLRRRNAREQRPSFFRR